MSITVCYTVSIKKHTILLPKSRINSKNPWIIGVSIAYVNSVVFWAIKNWNFTILNTIKKKCVLKYEKTIISVYYPCNMFMKKVILIGIIVSRNWNKYAK